MDQTARILESLERMLLAKAISPAEYLEGMAAAHIRASSFEKGVPVKIEALVTEMQEVVKEELIKQEAPVKVEAPVTSVKCVKSVMKAPVMKEFVPPLPSPRQVGEKAPSDNNNNKVVVVSVVGDRGMTEVGEHVSEEGNVGVSSVVLEGDLVGLLCTCSDKWSGIPNSFSATPFPADSHSV